MRKLNEMFSAMKTTILSMDKKNKTILGIVAVALVGAVTFGGYQLSTIGKTVDSDVKQTEKVKKTEDSKKDSSTDKKEVSKKAETKKGKEKEASEKKKESEKSEKSEKMEKSTSTKKGTANTEKTESSNTGNTSLNKTNSSNSGNTSSNTTNKQEAAKPAPKPEPTPEPAPQPTGPTEAELNALNEAEKQKVISQAQQNPGGMFDSMDAAAAWGYAQRRDESSPYFGKMFNAVGVGVGDETYGYIVVFN